MNEEELLKGRINMNGQSITGLMGLLAKDIKTSIFLLESGEDRDEVVAILVKLSAIVNVLYTKI